MEQKYAISECLRSEGVLSSTVGLRRRWLYTCTATNLPAAFTERATKHTCPHCRPTHSTTINGVSYRLKTLKLDGLLTPLPVVRGCWELLDEAPDLSVDKTNPRLSLRCWRSDKPLRKGRKTYMGHDGTCKLCDRPGLITSLVLPTRFLEDPPETEGKQPPDPVQLALAGQFKPLEETTPQPEGEPLPALDPWRGYFNF